MMRTLRDHDEAYLFCLDTEMSLKHHEIMRDLQSCVDEEYRKAPEEAMRLYDGKMIDEVFPHMLKSQLESRLNKLEAGRQAMLHERSGYIANIQKGTYLMWKEGLDQLEQFITLNLDWGTMLITEFNTNGDPERKHLFHSLIKNHSRACLVSEEILHLLKCGFPDVAFARWRSLYDVAPVLRKLCPFVKAFNSHP
jgi:hypothetical protein